MRNRDQAIEPFASLLGVASDSYVADRAGVSVSDIRAFRERRQAPPDGAPADDDLPPEPEPRRSLEEEFGDEQDLIAAQPPPAPEPPPPAPAPQEARAPRAAVVRKAKPPPKPAPKAEPKVEAKPAPKVEAKAAPKAEPKVEAKAAPKVEPKPAPKAVVKVAPAPPRAPAPAAVRRTGGRHAWFVTMDSGLERVVLAADAEQACESVRRLGSVSRVERLPEPLLDS